MWGYLSSQPPPPPFPLGEELKAHPNHWPISQQPSQCKKYCPKANLKRHYKHLYTTSNATAKMQIHLIMCESGSYSSFAAKLTWVRPGDEAKPHRITHLISKSTGFSTTSPQKKEVLNYNLSSTTSHSDQTWCDTLSWWLRVDPAACKIIRSRIRGAAFDPWCCTRQPGSSTVAIQLQWVGR